MNLSLILTWIIGLHASEPAASQAMLVDLGSETGSGIALQRIRDAAKAFCAEQPTTQDLDFTALNCRNDRTHRAVVTLGSARVKALYLDSPLGMELTASSVTSPQEQ